MEGRPGAGVELFGERWERRAGCGEAAERWKQSGATLTPRAQSRDGRIRGHSRVRRAVFGGPSGAVEQLKDRGDQ